MYAALVIKILFIHMMAVASPGPDFLIVTKNALNYSRNIGVWTAMGVGSGIAIHVIYGIGGISVLIAQNDLLYNSIKYAGSLYLLYLGVKSFSAVKEKGLLIKEEGIIPPLSRKKAFKMGFVTNVLNPKATMFFLSIFSALIPPFTPSYVLVVIALLLIINTGLWFIVVSYVFTQEKVQLLFYKYEQKINFVFGVLLILLALKIMFF